MTVRPLTSVRHVSLETFFGRRPTPGPVSTLTVFWGVFLMGVSAFILRAILPSSPPTLDMLLAACSGGTCGLAWLFSRALFSSGRKMAFWPIGLVGLLIFLSFMTTVMSQYSETTGMRYIASLQSLIGSAMLVLIALEPLNSAKAKTVPNLSAYFLAGYLIILAVSLMAHLPEAAAWQTIIQIFLCVIAVLLATIAMIYRRHVDHLSSGAVEADTYLAKKIVTLMERDALYCRPGLKVSDLARCLNVPEYKISQAIVHALGHPNFNRFVNQYRIREAKNRLIDNDMIEESILSISLDCGFNSLGPFNRAFKAETGLTPSAYRQRYCFSNKDGGQNCSQRS